MHKKLLQIIICLSVGLFSQTSLKAEFDCEEYCLCMEHCKNSKFPNCEEYCCARIECDPAAAAKCNCPAATKESDSYIKGL